MPRRFNVPGFGSVSVFLIRVDGSTAHRAQPVASPWTRHTRHTPVSWIYVDQKVSYPTHLPLP